MVALRSIDILGDETGAFLKYLWRRFDDGHGAFSHTLEKHLGVIIPSQATAQITL
jgi:hypothetical protein